MKVNKKGFTLIELLIVIVIIGILAVAVLSAINPIEQRNKGTDTALRSDAAELLNAVERYYASNGEYPWDAVSATVVPAAPGTAGIAANTLTDTFTELVAAGELKPEFQNRRNLAELLVWQDGGNQLVRVCFTPASRTFGVEPDADYFVNGQTASGCPGADPSASCQRCIPE